MAAKILPIMLFDHRHGRPTVSSKPLNLDAVESDRDEGMTHRVGLSNAHFFGSQGAVPDLCAPGVEIDGPTFLVQEHMGVLGDMWRLESFEDGDNG